jgi:hypothetical protein
MCGPDRYHGSRWRAPGVAAWLLVLLAAGLSGCGHEDTLGPPAVNDPPETHVTGATPVTLDAGFSIHLRWSGEDPEGEIRGFEWRLGEVGPSGAVLPASDEQQPWQFTTERENTLILGAGSAPLTAGEGSERVAGVACKRPVYVFMVRSVDGAGLVDPTPAEIGFTPTTLLPLVFVDRPARLRNYNDAQAMPPTARFGFTSIDPDHPLGSPAQFRYLLKTAWYQDHYVRTRYEYEQVVDEICSFDDPAWSDWLSYPTDPDDRQLEFPNLPSQDGEGRQICYLLALQVMDQQGAPSIDRRYSWNVQNFFIAENMAPELRMFEPVLGNQMATGLNGTVSFDILGGQTLSFSWIGSAEAYNGEIAAYRYGWDVADPADPNDPGWAIAPGNTPQHRAAPPRVFASGTHTLTIQVWDTDDQLTRFVWVLNVIPLPDWSFRMPLLLVDDVVDQNSNGWPSPGGQQPLDNDVFRDAFWQDVLAGSGGVSGFGAGDVIDTEDEPLALRDLVDYRTVLWITRLNTSSFISQTFQPAVDGTPRHDWLHTYQELAGNLFLVGSRTGRQFVPQQDFLMPLILGTSQDCQVLPWLPPEGLCPYELPDGSEIDVGTLYHPYRSMGVAVIDVMRTLRVWGGGERRMSCAGLKGLVPDPDFATSHAGFAGAVPEIVLTEPEIDWRDLAADYRDHLYLYPWGYDEFYDMDIADHATAWSPQNCGGQPCLEPMFRSLSRYDWVAELHAAAGDPDWPGSLFTPEELEDVCGSRTFAPGADRSLTSGLPVGFVSHKLEDVGSGRPGHVLWGFDPYRFDHAAVRGAIQWVLGEHFGLVMQP